MLDRTFWQLRRGSKWRGPRDAYVRGNTADFYDWPRHLQAGPPTRRPARRRTGTLRASRRHQRASDGRRPPCDRASRCACRSTLKTGAFFKTSRVSIEIPSTSLPVKQALFVDDRASIDHGEGIWFGEPVREMTIFAEQYDVSVSLLVAPTREVLCRKVLNLTRGM